MPTKHVKSVVLTQDPDLYNWIQDTLPNFSGTCVKILYALQTYHAQHGGTAAALDALLDDLARAGQHAQAGPVDYESLRRIIRQELHRALSSATILSPSAHPDPAEAHPDEEILANLEAIL